MAWRIFDELERFRDEMNQLLGSGWAVSHRPRLDGDPPVNLYETPEEFILVAEVPGADRQKFEISLTAGLLSIKGEYRQVADMPEWVREERAKGAFRRVVNLSDQVDPGRVEAAYKDGILTVRAAKMEAAKPKQIAVKVS